MPASLELSPPFDTTQERVGFPFDHPYVKHVYCSVLGPLGPAAADVDESPVAAHLERSAARRATPRTIAR